MKKELKNKIDTLVQSMYKSAKKSNAVKDVLDSDNIAEMDVDEVSVGSTNAMNKSKIKKKKDECEGPGEIEKTEVFIKGMIKNFKIISDAYMTKKEEDLEKARIDEGFSAGKKKKMRAERKPGFVPNKKEKFSSTGGRTMKMPTHQGELKTKLKEKQQSKPKLPSKENLEYPTPLAASEDKK